MEISFWFECCVIPVSTFRFFCRARSFIAPIMLNSIVIYPVCICHTAITFTYLLTKARDISATTQQANSTRSRKRTTPDLRWFSRHLDASLEDGDGELRVGAAAEPQSEVRVGLRVLRLDLFHVLV